ncbi:MAG: oxygen-independent coproporphyrinogen III oxidase [Pseudomonadota bacterium]
MDLEAVCFDPDLFERYGGRGPRYTSYPTALQFDGAFDERAYREATVASALADAEGRRPLSLYVHVPFCKSLCYYCGCNKIVTHNAERIQAYLDALHSEIGMQAQLFDGRRPVSQLHFGGGTPTYLTDQQLVSLMTALGDNFSLDRANDHEFSIEIDPRSTHDETMRLLSELGFNRVSLGIQDFDPQVQLAVNRLQSEQDVERLMEDVRAFGYRSVSFDLIYGLPHQSVASFDRTLDAAIRMRPDRLAVYNYAHLPSRFKGQRMIWEEELPTPTARIELLSHTIGKLTSAGYVYVGMDHFALPGDDLVQAKRNGTLQRNFQGYSTHSEVDLVALGVSAIGKIGNTFAQNYVTTSEYQDAIAAGRLAVCKGLVVDEDDQLRARVIHQVMCHDGLDYAAFGNRFDVDVRGYFADEIKRLAPLAKDELIVLDDRGFKVTPKGRLLLRNVAMVFDRHLASGAADQRFSKAI